MRVRVRVRVGVRMRVRVRVRVRVRLRVRVRVRAFDARRGLGCPFNLFRKEAAFASGSSAASGWSSMSLRAMFPREKLSMSPRVFDRLG